MAEGTPINVRAYVAGFLDGEGSIIIQRSKGRNAWTRQVTFVNTKLPVLTWIKAQYGGRIYPRKRRSERHAQSYALMIFRKAEILRILADVLPFLQIKHAQARNMLAFLNLPRVREVGVNLYEPADLEPRIKIASIQRELNRKGAA